MSKTLKVVLSVAIVIAIGGSYVFPKIQQQFGSVSGPDLYSPYFSVNGVRTEYRRTGLSLATTTPCAFKSPSATSTLSYAGLIITTASSTATTWTVAKATSAFATTTRLGVFSLGSGAQGTMVATTTASTAVPIVDEINTFAPNTYVVWGKAGDTPAGTGLAGFCSAEFTVI